MNTITTTQGETLYPLPNVLGLRINTLCRNQMGMLVLVHNASKRTQLFFEPGCCDGTIQGAVMAIERYGDILPFELNISMRIPPINENL